MAETRERQEWQMQGKDQKVRNKGRTRMSEIIERHELQRKVKDKNARDKIRTRKQDNR